MTDKQFCQGEEWKPYSGVCGACGRTLTGRNNYFCKGSATERDSCAVLWKINHDWWVARREAIRRGDHKCARCGSREQLEVNHITPRNGMGYGDGCCHHQDKLEVLCHGCHAVVTAKQAAARAKSRPVQKRAPPGLSANGLESRAETSR